MPQVSRAMPWREHDVQRLGPASLARHDVVRGGLVLPLGPFDGAYYKLIKGAITSVV